MARDAHRVLLITTGGTIAGQVADTLQDAAMKRTAGEFSALIGEAVEYLNIKHSLDISIESHELTNVDSSDIQPAVWTELAETVRERYDEHDSFLITHGTNTLGYTCAALSFALVNPAKPIILTGSQVSAGLPGSDGLTNLENALRVATWPRTRNPIKGVLAVFGSHIITGTRVKKDTEFDYDAFKSFSSASIGRIGRVINISEPNLEKHLKYLSTGMYPEARDAASLRCESEFDMRIASITEFPGMDSGIFATLVERNDVQGFVLRAFGAGDPATKHREAFEYLKGREIPIVVTTQAPNGNSNFQVNEPGEFLREHQLAIPAFDMSIEAQTTKLGWLLAKRRTGDMPYARLREEMVHDIRGEINVLWEVGV
ncbi:MAG TPA: asparaginase [Solirubrobacteraceae bacterium]|nr:asparaginase [Solirubrobacteraceae bacterium]HUB75291.1 asparaginase [Solirubrobacteraceae bacterium]